MLMNVFNTNIYFICFISILVLKSKNKYELYIIIIIFFLFFNPQDLPEFTK